MLYRTARRPEQDTWHYARFFAFQSRSKSRRFRPVPGAISCCAQNVCPDFVSHPGFPRFRAEFSIVPGGKPAMNADDRGIPVIPVGNGARMRPKHFTRSPESTHDIESYLLAIEQENCERYQKQLCCLTSYYLQIRS